MNISFLFRGLGGVILTYLKGICIGKPQKLLASTNGGRFTVAYVEPKKQNPIPNGTGFT
jgi:hypothetical protein